MDGRSKGVSRCRYTQQDGGETACEGMGTGRCIQRGREWWTIGCGGMKGRVVWNSYREMDIRGWTLGVDAGWTQASKGRAWMQRVG